MFIAHDLSVVRFISDRIGVIYKGHIVEVAEAEELFNFPLHPYTHSLISAIPIPDPKLEKNKELYIYDPSMHDYSQDKPELVDIGNDHWVYGNKAEIEKYKALRQKNEPIKSVKILDPSEERENNSSQMEAALKKAEEEFLAVPVSDKGSLWMGLLAFFLPVIGIIAALICKKKKHYRNYRILKKGAIAGFAVILIILAIFILGLIKVVI